MGIPRLGRRRLNIEISPCLHCITYSMYADDVVLLGLQVLELGHSGLWIHLGQRIV